MLHKELLDGGRESQLSDESVNAALASVRRWDRLGNHNHGVERMRNEMGQNRVHQVIQHYLTELQVSKYLGAEVAGSV